MLEGVDSETLEIVFVGGGHASIQVLKAIGEQLPQIIQQIAAQKKLKVEELSSTIRVTLINELPFAVYSGMIPGVICNQYKIEETMFSLFRFSEFLAKRNVQFTFLCCQAVSVSWKKRVVVCKSTLEKSTQFWEAFSKHDQQACQAFNNVTSFLSPEQQPLSIYFDVLIVDIGSSSKSVFKIPGVLDHAICTRPIALLPQKIANFEKELYTILKQDKVLETNDTQATTQHNTVSNKMKRISVKVIVAGGGAAGIEIATTVLARLKSTFAKHLHLIVFNICIIDSKENLTQSLTRGSSPSLGSLAESTLKEKGIQLMFGVKITKVEMNTLHLDNGKLIPFHMLVWACGADAPQFIGQMGLMTDTKGFLKVNKYLQSVSNPCVFGVGDCISLEGHEDLPKAGVFAVREGPILAQNIMTLLTTFLQKYKPPSSPRSSHRHPPKKKASAHKIELVSKRVEYLCDADYIQKSMVPFTPQKGFLKLLNLGPGCAIGEFKNVGFGPYTWVFWMKDKIDKKFMKLFSFLTVQAEAVEGFLEEQKHTLKKLMEQSSQPSSTAPPATAPISIPDHSNELTETSKT